MPTTSKHLFGPLLRALARLRRLPQRLPAFRALVELRCARRLDRMGKRLLRMRTRIDAMSRHLGSGALDGPAKRLAADEDGNLRRMLAGLREEVGTMRRDLALWHVRECGGRTGVRLAAALARLNGIAGDTWTAALHLENQLDEHERLRLAGVR